MLRFVVYSVAITVSIYLAFMLVDMKKGTASEKAFENLLIAVIIGLATSASITFAPKFFKKPRE